MVESVAEAGIAVEANSSGRDPAGRDPAGRDPAARDAGPAPIDVAVRTGLDPAALRRAFGSFGTGVTIVTTRDADGRPVGMTVNSFTAVSLDPPLLLWCIQRQVWPFAAFHGSDRFAVHVLHAGQRALSDRFAGTDTNRFEGVALAEGIDGLPLLAEHAACFQCRVEHRYDGGDHLILVGRVLEASCRDLAPLLFHGGRYLDPGR